MKTVLLYKPIVLTGKTLSTLVNPSPKKEIEELDMLNDWEPWDCLREEKNKRVHG